MLCDYDPCGRDLAPVSVASRVRVFSLSCGGGRVTGRTGPRQGHGRPQGRETPFCPVRTRAGPAGRGRGSGMIWAVQDHKKTRTREAIDVCRISMRHHYVPCLGRRQCGLMGYQPHRDTGTARRGWTSGQWGQAVMRVDGISTSCPCGGTSGSESLIRVPKTRIRVADPSPKDKNPSP